MISFRNGRLVPQGELALACHDAGFVSGTTITDYCRTHRQELFRWPDHLARFRSDCTVCGIELAYPDAQLTDAAGSILAAHLALHPWRPEFAVITFATPGPFGYMKGDYDDGPPTVGMHAFAVPFERYQRFFEEGAVLEIVGVLPQIEGGIVPHWIKHRSRLHWTLAAQQRTAAENVPVLVDQFGSAPDTAIGSVLAVVEGVVTRPQRGTVLESISLKIAEEKCRELGLGFAEFSGDWRKHFLLATEVLICGSAFGIAGVRQVGVSKYEWPGKVLRELENVWWDSLRE